MKESLAHRGVFVFTVVDNIPLCREHYRLVLTTAEFPEASPGQFVQIQCRDNASKSAGWSGGPFVRRPFSIGGLRRTANRVEIDILHRVVGPGTTWLSKLQQGDSVSIIGPLGQPFVIPHGKTTAYLIGGGIGLPPLMWLAEALQEAGIATVAFCGARSHDLIPLTRIDSVDIQAGQAALAYEEFAQNQASVVVATDDGSLGYAGYVPDAFAAYLDNNHIDPKSAVVYTCGPDVMMRATAHTAETRGMDCFVCLERMMACGMGTCQSCVVRVHEPQADEGWRYQLCCTDGPVFAGPTVIWKH